MSETSCICGSPHGQHYADCPVLLKSEITRLRNELHLAQEWSARVIAGHEQDIAEITALRAKVERLEGALVVWQNAYKTGRNEPLVQAYEHCAALGDTP